MVLNNAYASPINLNPHQLSYRFIAGVLPMDSGVSAAPVVASETDPSIPSRPPRRRERKKSTPPSPKLTSNGLPPTPKVHMGACFSKVFNGCPLGIHGTATWIHPETRDQHILIAAEEGLYTLNLNQLHDAYVHLLYPRRTIWMVVVKGLSNLFQISMFIKWF
jgi:hypothetical protein